MCLSLQFKPMLWVVGSHMVRVYVCVLWRVLQREKAGLVSGKAFHHPKPGNDIGLLWQQRGPPPLVALKRGLEKNNQRSLASAKWGSDMRPGARCQLNGTLFPDSEAWSPAPWTTLETITLLPHFPFFLQTKSVTPVQPVNSCQQLQGGPGGRPEVTRHCL